MGWFLDGDAENAGHEGYVVGLVEDAVTWPAPAGGGGVTRTTFLRELSYYSDHGRDVPAGGLPVSVFQVACECGWRSRRFLAPSGARWHPWTLELGDSALEEAACRLWREHCADERRRGTGGDADKARGLTRFSGDTQDARHLLPVRAQPASAAPLDPAGAGLAAAASLEGMPPTADAGARVAGAVLDSYRSTRDRCSTSLREDTDPFVWLEGDTGEPGAWATCGMCFTRGQLLPPTAPGGCARFPEHAPPPAVRVALPERLVTVLLLAEKAGIHAIGDGECWRAMDRNYDLLVEAGNVQDLRDRGLLVPRGPGRAWSAAARLGLPPDAVVLVPSTSARALLAGVKPLRPPL